jgi:sterol desaturase/sphingolipid hydroxylase (fatty acid hydroxylase superfamily)
MFNKLKGNVEDTKEHIKKLVEGKLAYYKLWVFKVIVKSVSSLFQLLLIGILLVMVFVFFSIAAAISIGYAFNNYALGFLILGGIYLLLTFVVFALRRRIEKPIVKTLSEIFYNDED